MKKLLILAFILILPASISALIMASFDDPYVIRGLSDNSITDIIVHNDAVWMSTGMGLSFQYFGDDYWNQYDSTNGLTSDAVSAMYSHGGRLWVAGNYFIEGDDSTYGDGLYYTDDDGLTWNNITPENTTGGLRVIYDIDGIDDYIFCASWIGGLIASFDGGENWKNIYFTASDSVYVNQDGYPNQNDPDLVPLYSNMYFSAAVDTTHTDSTVLWAGCVDGIRRFVYAPPYVKPNSNYILDFIAADSFVYACGDRGLTRIEYSLDDDSTVLTSFYSAFESDGLPGPTVTTAYEFGGRLFVGTTDTLEGDGAGVAVSDDDGKSFTTGLTGLDDVVGPGRYAEEFAEIGYHIFMAAREAGLYMSSDTGNNWQKVYLDAADTTLLNGRNIINSVVADSNNLWIGTDSGVVLAYVNDLGGIDSTSFMVFAEDAAGGARSYQLGVQEIRDTLGNLDSTIIWTINHPLDTAVGNYAVFFSNDNGQNWEGEQFYLTGIKYFDIEFINKIIYLVGTDNLTQSPDRVYWYPTPGSLINDGIKTFTGLDITSIEIKSDTIFLGSENGMAVSPPTGSVNFTWNIYRANQDPSVPDDKTVYRYPSLSSDFVNAMDIQPLDNGQSRIWASTRYDGENGYDAISTSTLDGLDWQIHLENSRAWNFAFNGPEVFAATSSGLMFSPDTGRTWDTLVISGVKVTADEDVEFTMDTNVFVTAVTIVNDTLWVGTAEDGAARIALSDIGDDDWEIYRVYDSTMDVYAFPIPFSTNQTGSSNIYFHYPMEQDGEVTIEVYDFKLDLIATVAENVPQVAGIHHGDIWWNNPRLDGGAPLAVGIYYFKVEISTGETYWGKLAIIP